MEETRLAEALIVVIEKNRDNPDRLRELAISLPGYLRKIIGDIESIEGKFECLMAENKILLSGLDDQETFEFFSEQSRAEQSRAEQSRAEQSRAEQSSLRIV